MRTIEFNGITLYEEESYPNLYVAKRVLPGLNGVEFIEVQATDPDNELWTWKNYFVPHNQSTATGAEKIFMRYLAVGWEASADIAMSKSLSAFHEFRVGIQQLRDCKADLMKNQACPLTQSQFNPNACNPEWAKKQTEDIPDILKPGWRDVYAYLLKSKSLVTANQFLYYHAKTTLTCKHCKAIAIPSVSINPMAGGKFQVRACCASCNGWIKWLKVGGAL